MEDTKSLTMAFRMSGVNSLRFSLSFCLSITFITDGLHLVGRINLPRETLAEAFDDEHGGSTDEFPMTVLET